MQITPAVQAVLAAWRLPVGLYESDQNANLIRAEIDKLPENFPIAQLSAKLYAIVYGLDTKLTWTPGYAPSEQRAVMAEWFRQHKNVLQSDKNFSLIAVRIRDYYNSNFTLDNVEAAAKAVESKLEGKSAAQLQRELEEQQANFERIEFARIQREKIENTKVFDTDAARKKVEKERAAADHAKTQEQAQREIDAFRANFTVNGMRPNTIDHTLSQQCAKAFNIKVNKGNKYDAVLTLAVIRRAASMLSDRPNAAEVIQACEKATNQLIDAQAYKPDQGPIR